MAMAVSLIATLIVVLLIFKPWKTQSDLAEREPGPEKTLVVLPFENLGAEDDEYFADGITDEITSRLAKIAGLHVISRTSAMQYKNTDKGLKQIGTELGVAYVLEGTIRWDKSTDTNRVRITPQLIEVDNDFHVWAENYERAMTQIFDVQSDIATQIASALNVALVGEPDVSHPTDNLDAYAYFLRGMEYLGSDYWNSAGDALTAISLFEKAIALDSNFAEPFAGIGVAISGPLWNSGSGNMDLLAKADDATERALILAPELPLSHSAKGLYHLWVEQDYDLALQEFTRARQLGGDNGQVLLDIAMVQMRQGRWSEAVRNLVDAAAHDPRSVNILGTLSDLYWILHRFDDAIRTNERALTVAPDQPGLYGRRAHLLLGASGDTARAGQVIRDGVSRLNSLRPLTPYEGEFPFHLWRYQFVEVTPAKVRASFAEILTRSDLENELFGLAQVYHSQGQRDSALIHHDSLITLLREDVQKAPDDFHYKMNLGISCLMAGYHEEALRYARLGMEDMPISSCHW
jgi:TolB-like protein/Flp pilus assembly protein TadD